jgi:multicomponent Na+:H+ antiporter subunit D
MAARLPTALTRFSAGAIHVTAVSPREFEPEMLLAPGVALACLGVALLRRRPVSRWARLAFRLESVPVRLLDALHSGIVTDYVAWMTVGLAMLAAAATLA